MKALKGKYPENLLEKATEDSLALNFLITRCQSKLYHPSKRLLIILHYTVPDIVKLL
jgi:hypothetical protein